MTEKAIQFSDPMVRAILDGRKTQTRRVFKSKEENATGNCPYGKPGNMLWVRESWQALPYYDDIPPRDLPEGADIIYNADRPHAPWDSRKRNALYMPRWASRITLKITDVRVERTQDISEDDARAEGVNTKEEFQALWESIHGDDPVKGWAANPFVWVIEFERIKP